MTTRPTSAPLWVLALSTFSAAPAAAQAIAYREALPPGLETALPDVYRLRLTSAWPQSSSVVAEECRNGGDEVVEGTLTRSADGAYHGSLHRRTLILFCGAHGADGEACQLVLEGDGKVAMSGVLVPDETSSSGRALRVSWRPSPTHGAMVRGACSADFKRSIEEMYLSVAHGAEFAIPQPGAGRRVERLENYAWEVEIE